jgi:hypothetical protein
VRLFERGNSGREFLNRGTGCLKPHPQANRDERDRREQKNSHVTSA